MTFFFIMYFSYIEIHFLKQILTFKYKGLGKFFWFKLKFETFYVVRPYVKKNEITNFIN